MSLKWKQLGLLAKHHAEPRAKGWRSDGTNPDPVKARLLAGLQDLKKPRTITPEQPAPVVEEPKTALPLLIYDRADGQNQLSALTMYSAHPLPLGAYTFPSAAHLLECAHYVCLLTLPP